ncbi:MAG: hypothetical protein ACRC8S_01325 [Fimbriiglobus sp.]
MQSRLGNGFLQIVWLDLPRLFLAIPFMQCGFRFSEKVPSKATHHDRHGDADENRRLSFELGFRCDRSGAGRWFITRPARSSGTVQGLAHEPKDCNDTKDGLNTLHVEPPYQPYRMSQANLVRMSGLFLKNYWVVSSP